MGSECSIAGCSRPAVARSWCRAHWKHWRRWGDPEFFQTYKPRVAPEERFWPKVAKAGPDECWEWTAARDELGYGFFRMEPGRNMWRANRAAWVFTYGEIPEGMIVCHSCDNPPCVNPAHLWLGFDADNAADKAAKGRGRTRPQRSEDSPLAKLDRAQVAEIRAAYAAGGVLQRELGAKYGVSQTTIGRIVRGERWI